jgi:hypothetical protein
MNLGFEHETLAPMVLKLGRAAMAHSRSMQQGHHNNKWVCDVAGVLTMDAVV